MSTEYSAFERTTINNTESSNNIETSLEKNTESPSPAKKFFYGAWALWILALLGRGLWEMSQSSDVVITNTPWEQTDTGASRKNWRSDIFSENNPTSGTKINTSGQNSRLETGVLVTTDGTYKNTSEKYAWEDPTLDEATYQDLWGGYGKDKSFVYYQRKAIKYLEPKDIRFVSGWWAIEWEIITPSSLQKQFEKKENRVILMYQLDDIFAQHPDLAEEMKQASAVAIHLFKWERDVLAWYTRGDEIPETERAKFALLFLYTKYEESLSTSEVTMERAIVSLDEFIQTYKNDANFRTEIEKSINHFNQVRALKGEGIATDYCRYEQSVKKWCMTKTIFSSQE
jgi:hypothetical protein